MVGLRRISASFEYLTFLLRMVAIPLSVANLPSLLPYPLSSLYFPPLPSPPFSSLYFSLLPPPSLLSLLLLCAAPLSLFSPLSPSDMSKSKPPPHHIELSSPPTPKCPKATFVCLVPPLLMAAQTELVCRRLFYTAESYEDLRT